MTQTPKKEGKMTISKNELHYAVYGDGEPLILLHGWTQTSSFWSSFVPALMAKYEVYVVDLPGHGKSGLLNDEFTIQKAARDMIGFMEQLNLKNVQAVGMSFGGILLLEIAADRPDLIRSMVVIGAVYDFNGAESGPKDFSWKDLPENYQNQLLKEHMLGEAQLNRLFNPELDYQVHLSPGELGQIKARTLIISGGEDNIAGPATAEELNNLINDSDLWIIPGKGHVPFDISNEKEFLHQVTLFLD